MFPGDEKTKQFRTRLIRKDRECIVLRFETMNINSLNVFFIQRSYQFVKTFHWFYVFIISLIAHTINSSDLVDWEWPS